jgi:hypothetical protein
MKDGNETIPHSSTSKEVCDRFHGNMAINYCVGGKRENECVDRLNKLQCDQNQLCIQSRIYPRCPDGFHACATEPDSKDKQFCVHENFIGYYRGTYSQLSNTMIAPFYVDGNPDQWFQTHSRKPLSPLTSSAYLNI